MKCPKCGYVSFDYNLSCPKCGKDISSEQGKLNLPAFKPNPPSLLGTLTGEAGESSVELSVSDSTDVSFARETVQGFGDSSIIDTGGGSLDSSDELDLSLEADEGKPVKDTGEFELDIGEKSLSDLDVDESASQELSLESDSLTLEQGTVEQEAALGAGAKAAPEAEKEEEEIDLGSLELTGAGGAEEKGEIELKLDDLKINDTGSLEVGEKASAATESATTEIDKPIDIDEITLDEIPLIEELPPEDASKEGGKKEKAEGAPELSTDEGEAIDLDDLDLDIDVEEEPKQA